MSNKEPQKPKQDKHDYRELRKTIRAKKDRKMNFRSRSIITGALVGFVITLLLFIGFDKVTKPLSITYENAVNSIESKDEFILIQFNEDVSDYNMEFAIYEGLNQYRIMGWTTYLSKLSTAGEPKSAIINNMDKNIDAVYYSDQDGDKDRLIYGNPDYYSGIVDYPMIILNFYFILASVAFGILLLLSLVFKKHKVISKILLPLMLLPLSFVLSYIIIVGISGMTYHLKRDLVFIAVTAILFFIVFILALYNEELIKE